jgi:hypothetical protein
MNVTRPILLGLTLAFAGGTLAASQEMSGPPKVLQVDREFLKPGKAGAAHDRSESAFVQAMARAKAPTHYIALNSMSGKSRALYLIAYSSFDAVQKDEQAMDKSALGPQLDRLTESDGSLLDSFDQFFLTYDPDISYHAGNGDISSARYMEITTFKVKPGHTHEFEEIAKMVMAGHEKAGDSAHWATYEVAYGGSDEYVILSSDKSLSEIDQSYTEGKQFVAAMGEEGLKKLDQMVRDVVDSSDSQLFSINPRQSYPPEEWVKANPDFWKPKSMSAPAPAAAPAAPAKKTNP